MGNNVEFYNQTNEEVEEFNSLEKVLSTAIQMEGLENVSFNVILVDDETIHQFNKEYRGVDKVTDVITFALEDEKEVVLPAGMRVLGDIYICLNKARSQAEEYGHSFYRELSFLAVHGFYHLLGYDHQTKEEEKIMFQKQEEVLAKNKITR